METKMFEVRDRDTFIPVVATKLVSSDNEAESYLIKQAGYDTRRNHILLSKIEGGICKSNYDALDWLSEGTRTMKIAHEYIRDLFDRLESGAVVDVEFLLKETDNCKITQRL